MAARYAKAPSFSEMQAGEARVAMRAAEAATRKALEAQAAAQEALFQWESAAADEAAEREEPGEFVAGETHAEPAMEMADVPIAQTPAEGLEIRWEPDMPPPPVAPPMAYAQRENRLREGRVREDWVREGAVREHWSSGSYEMERALEPVEPPQAIPANLIEFPRELVATRRMRPRISGADPNATGELFGQLSIFEVDPTTISTEAAATAAMMAAMTATEEAVPAAEWNGPEWSSIQLDAQPVHESAEELAARAALAGEPALELAPMGLRALAALVDVSLVAAVACGAAYWAAGHLHAMPTMRTAEMGGAGMKVELGAAYYALFLLLAGATPGMWYARVRLRDFENEQPSRMQMRGRVLAMAVSMLPVGLGLMWAVFD
ncbi:MAG: RDD family protein, partial [Terriglobales bacterium]